MLKLSNKSYVTESHINKVLAPLKGKKGTPALREKMCAYVAKKENTMLKSRPWINGWYRKMNKDEYLKTRHNERLSSWKSNMALNLSKKAGQYYDEHGYNRGDYMNTHSIDFIPSWESVKSPYFDMGGEGLALVSVSRKRVYARSSSWGPSYAETRYLVGKNEAGTYFAHPVPKNIATVKDAISWIWSGLENYIIVRQGDIALVVGKGPKGLDKLPSGHNVKGDNIVHDTHPAIPVPSKGQKIIIGRRASVQVSEATRD